MEAVNSYYIYLSINSIPFAYSMLDDCLIVSSFSFYYECLDAYNLDKLCYDNYSLLCIIEELIYCMCIATGTYVST